MRRNWFLFAPCTALTAIVAFALPGCSENNTEQKAALSMVTPRPHGSKVPAVSAGVTPRQVADNGQDLSPDDFNPINIESQQMKWIQKIRRESETVTAGMTRRQLTKIFTPVGDSRSSKWRRYVHRECPYLKIDVTFRLARHSKKYPIVESPNDVIIASSGPFLDSIDGQELSVEQSIRSHPVDRQNIKLIENGLREIETVKVGMTRGQYGKVFEMDGGLNSMVSPRSISREYPFIKADVTFKLVNTSKKYPYSLSERDVITQISKPYLGFDEYTD